jgi:2-dehydro-3-deoxyphosphogluconate aldolase / (4S)-4-hydroxy-2-oxoglutarate aldolase
MMPTRATSTDRMAVLTAIEHSGLVAIIRADSGEGLLKTFKALADGGVTVSEVTLTTPGALASIAEARRTLGAAAVIGAGSVLDAPSCRAAIEAGASFIVSPITNLDVMRTAQRYGRPVMPGALTPTEAMAAFEQGADMVKIFPANHFGPRYISDLLAPMPQLRLIPTGGVTLENASQWLDAGAAALGVGTALVRKDLIAAGDFKALTALAGRYVDAVRQARNRNKA